MRGNSDVKEQCSAVQKIELYRIGWIPHSSYRTALRLIRTALHWYRNMHDI